MFSEIRNLVFRRVNYAKKSNESCVPQIYRLRGEVIDRYFIIRKTEWAKGSSGSWMDQRG